MSRVMDPGSAPRVHGHIRWHGGSKKRILRAGDAVRGHGEHDRIPAVFPKIWQAHSHAAGGPARWSAESGG